MSSPTLGVGRIEPRELEEEMRTSFLDYAMSVIVARALPDVRDGLKPVHRRVLFAMHEAGLQPNRPRVKCATVIGEVMGSYPPARRRVDLRHPRPDGAEVRPAIPLVDPQGTSVTSTATRPPRIRYTEARLPLIAPSCCATSTRTPSSSSRTTTVPANNRPCCLAFPEPSRQRLVGIAVGMATNMPPHKLGEVIDAIVAMIDEPTIESIDSYSTSRARLPDRRRSSSVGRELASRIAPAAGGS